VPGAHLFDSPEDRVRGKIRASLGPIETLFVGEGSVAFDDAQRQAEISGTGRDSRTGTHLSARVVAHLRAVDSASTDLLLEVAYTLRGPLAQFARGTVMQEFATAILASFAANLEARLAGAPVPRSATLSAGALLWHLLWRRLLALLRIR
jgi:carbon-monoxide dehydrogenase small subunit